MSFLDTYKHLLPNARAWRLTAEKTLRKFFEGLTGLPADYVTFNGLVWLDIFPSTTREITAWENQFALTNTGLSDSDRRDRLDGSWKALGRQDLKYIEDTLQDAGFDVFVHEWWVPGTEPPPGVKACTVPRNPLLVIRPEFIGLANTFIVGCGEPLAQCGEAFAESGNSVDAAGYPLVNPIITSSTEFLVLCGEPVAESGEPDALCGSFSDFNFSVRNFIVPDDPAKWPYFLYIGGPNFGDIATILPSRRDEFETLALKICPTQQWLGILVQFA